MFSSFTGLLHASTSLSMTRVFIGSGEIIPPSSFSSLHVSTTLNMTGIPMTAGLTMARIFSSTIRLTFVCFFFIFTPALSLYPQNCIRIIR